VGPLNVFRLRRLVAAAEQKDDYVALRSEIDAIAGAIVDSQFRDALANRPRVPKVAVRYPFSPADDPNHGLIVPKRFQPLSENVCLIDLDHVGKP